MGTPSNAAPFSAPSEEVLNDLKKQIADKMQWRVENLRLSVCDNGLVIGGQACTYFAKQMAQCCLLEATNLPLSANEIEVIETRGRVQRPPP